MINEKLEAAFQNLRKEDLTVLCGDLSWAMSLEQAKEDFAFVDRLPGQKLILKGNHDYWWTTAQKTYRFFAENGFTTLRLLHNNACILGDWALCGTRGWFFEEDHGTEHDRKMMLREVQRLEASLKAGEEKRKIVFLHYPPVFQHYRCDEILRLLQDYRVEHCYYGHIHGKGRQFSFNGRIGFTEFHLVSADQLNFIPEQIPL